MYGARGEVEERPRALEALEKDVTMSSTSFASGTATASGTQVVLLGPNCNCSSDLPLSDTAEALQMMPATAREDLNCTRGPLTNRTWIAENSILSSSLSQCLPPDF